MKIYAYLRVSTEQQDLKSQKLGIEKYIKAQGYNAVTWVQETVSGSVEWEKRQLAHIFQEIASGDILIVSELSRIGRSTIDVLQFMRQASLVGLSIHAIKNNITLDGSIQSTIFATMMGLMAEVERDFIRSRTKEGMARAKAEGKSVGRPKGAKSKSKIDKFGDEIDRLLAAKVAKSSICRVLSVSRGTIDRYLNKKRTGVE